MTTPIIDWHRLGRTVVSLAVGWVVIMVVGLAVSASLSGGLDRAVVSLWVGLGTAGLVATLVAALALSALRGMLHVGDRGERLAGDDVGLTPPQVRRRRADREEER